MNQNLKSGTTKRNGTLLEMIRPSRLIPSLVIGSIVGAMEVVVAVSFAALVFAGALAEFRAVGIVLGLIGATVSIGLISVFSSWPGMMGGVQDSPAAIMGVVTASIAGTLVAAGASASQLLATVLLAIVLASVGTGLSMYFLGRFEMGSLVRFLPYPVIGGFLAGTGWLLAVGALGLMTDLSIDIAQLDTLIQPDYLVLWLPGLGLALILLWALKRFRHVLLMPGLLVGVLLLFYLVVWIGRLPLEQLREQGWLLGGFAAVPIGQALPWEQLGEARLSAVVGQLPNIGALIVLSTVGLLLNVSGLEVVIQRDVNFNRELRAAGLGNVAAGLFGGLVSYHQLSLSTLSVKQERSSRLAGLVAASVCLLVLVIGTELMFLLPRFVAGGLLLYLGLLFLKDWVVDGWTRLSRIDYVIVLFILAVIIGVGFLEGVAVGVVSAVIMFAVAYSRIDVVRSELSGLQVGSRVTRSPAARAYLRRMLNRVYVLKLQGFIFFGTADRLFNQIQERLEQRGQAPAEYVILDFGRVTGVDSTAVSTLVRLRQRLAERGGKLFIAQASAALRDGLYRGGLTEQMVTYVPDLDRGVEDVETEFLQRREAELTAVPETIETQLAEIVGESEGLTVLLSFLERLELAAGDYLMRQGDQPDNLYFIESGQVSALLEFEDRPPLRLQTMNSGNVVGEIGYYLDQARTASVVAEKPSVVYRLTLEQLSFMEKTAPIAASTLHRLMVHLLAERVTQLVNTVQALEN
ncbi:MAG: SulP family inorganic anion transporter [Candidatus Promineifilaceae bacterium]|nr:SulP family inorganic anion transporter [Candidatus Promineifilaceae bacterium]